MDEAMRCSACEGGSAEAACLQFQEKLCRINQLESFLEIWFFKDFTEEK